MGSKKVLIGGGTGFVGGAVVRACRQRGLQPVILTRSRTSKSSSGQSHIQWSDLKKNGFPDNVYAVVNLAGKNIADPMNRWTKAFKDEVFESRVHSTKFLADLIKESSIECRPKVFVSSSAVGFYGASETCEYDEDSEGGKDTNFFTQLCNQWEEAATLPDDIQVRKVIVRIGLVLGRNGGIIANSFWQFFCGVGGPMGSGQQWFPWIHVTDCANIFAHAVANESVNGVLNATAPDMIRNKEFATAFGKALGRPAVIPMPESAIRTIFGTERAELFLTGQKVYPKRTLESGFEFEYGRIGEAAGEFSRMGLTEGERGQETSATPFSWRQETAAYRSP